MKFESLSPVIGAGFPKCGTTFLHRCLVDNKLFASPRGKETFYFNFNYDKGDEYYRDQFEIRRSNRFILDITPSYLHHPDLKRRCGDDDPMARLTRFFDGRRIRLIICIRHPVVRAFSHYIHDIRFHHAPWDESKGSQEAPFAEPYDVTFFEERSLKHLYHFMPYSDHVEAAIKAVGRENCLFLVQERDFLSNTHLSRTLSAFLDVSISIKIPPTKIHAGSLPRYTYTGARSFDFFDGLGQGTKYPPFTLLLIHQGEVIKTFTDFDPVKAGEVIRKSSRWTSFVPSSWIDETYQRVFAQDTARLQDLTGIDLSHWEKSEDVRYDFG